MGGGEKMLKRFRARAGFVLGLTALSVVGFAQSAFATANADSVTAVTDATTTLKDTITAALPLILGVAVIMVVLRLSKKLVNKAG